MDPIADVLEEVDDLVARLMEAPRNTWWKAVRENEYRRPDVARRLLSLAMEARLRDRLLAVDLAKAATTIVDFCDSPGVEELRFESWKFASAILREAGRYAELPTAFVKAAEAAPATTNPELAHASVLLSRALYYSEPDIWKPKKAAALLDRAEPVFVRSDASRMHALRTARAFLLFRSGDMRAAREAFATLLAITPENDRDVYLHTLINSIAVRVELRETGPEIEQALTLLISRTTEATVMARAHWLLGRVHLIRGEYDTAVDFLTSAMESIGDSDSSIRVGLDAIQGLLLSKRFHEAHALARTLTLAAAALDRRQPDRRHDLTEQVAAYLREAAQLQAV